MEGVLDGESHHLVLRCALAGADLDPFADLGILAREGIEGIGKHPFKPGKEVCIFAFKIKEKRGVECLGVHPPELAAPIRELIGHFFGLHARIVAERLTALDA